MSFLPEWPLWAWLLLAHLAGLAGGFTMATVMGIGRAVHQDTLHFLADNLQAREETT